MEVSLNWIKKYVDLDTDIETLSKALTSLGFEVEGCHTQGSGIQNVVVGEVMECSRHPEADKLSVCRVSDGTEVYPVVCGAPNVAAGQKVLLAKVGAELPGKAPGEPSFKIKKAKLRGQDSHGMICAEDELGLGESHDGILILDANLPLGLPLNQIPGLCDTLFEINVTPNRPDALCHIGVARELAAKFGKPLRYPFENADQVMQITHSNIGEPAQKSISIKLEDEIGCPYYSGRIIRNVKVGPSPEWLVKALKSLGKRSINNVVDLTNYVLLEWGQPSHAFDLDKISDQKVLIRKANSGEKLLTLDGVERTLSIEDTVIADSKSALVLAGVMGGKSSEVDLETKNIFLEVAYFNSSMVRKQGRRHGLTSDSAYRFERGIDPLNTNTVGDYLAGLLAKWCGGSVAEGVITCSSQDHMKSPRLVSLRPSRVTKLLGIVLTPEEIINRLQGIEIIKQEITQVFGEEAMVFSIPGYRIDLEREVDLVEEIARLVDYNTIPAILPSLPLGYKPLPPTENISKTLRHFLRDAGLNETLNLRFSSRKSLGKLGLSEKDPRQSFVPLRNPISEEWEILPTTTLPSLLNAVAYNQKNQERDCRFFEIAKSFYHKPEERTDRTPGIWEEETLFMVITGEWSDRRPWTKDEAKATESAPFEFFHLKGLLENVLRSVDVSARYQFPGTENYLHPLESGVLLANLGPAPVGAEILQGWKRGGGSQKSARIGSFGVLHPRVQNAFDLQGTILVAEISLSGLLAAEKRSKKFSAFGHFSMVTRDLNLVVDDGRNHGDILDKMPVSRIANLQEVRLNSIYRGQGVPEGKKALHYSFVYRNSEKTLTDEEVNKAQEKLNSEIAKDTGIIFK